MVIVVVVIVFSAGAHRVTEPGSQTPIQMGQVTLKQRTPIELRHSAPSLHQPSLASLLSEGIEGEEIPAEDEDQVEDYS